MSADPADVPIHPKRGRASLAFIGLLCLLLWPFISAFEWIHTKCRSDGLDDPSDLAGAEWGEESAYHGSDI
jgi:hypothetical protein